MLTNLTDRAMLVRLEITQWSARKYDKKISAEVAHNHGTSTDAGRYNKRLIAANALKEIASTANAARTEHYENTLPWRDDGARILPAANYFEHAQRMQRARAEFERLTAQFVVEYPGFVDDARVSLNGLFDEADYPKPHEIARKFSFATVVDPLPSAGDFRADLSAGDVARIKADIEARGAEAMKNATRDLWDRIHAGVSRMAERLKAYTVDAAGKVQNPFRDSLVENLRELVELLPRLNVTGDAALDAMARQLAQELTTYDAQELRDNESARRDTAARAEALLAGMAGYCSAA